MLFWSPLSPGGSFTILPNQSALTCESKSWLLKFLNIGHRLYGNPNSAFMYPTHSPGKLDQKRRAKVKKLLHQVWWREVVQLTPLLVKKLLHQVWWREVVQFNSLITEKKKKKHRS